jgi:hypothetical protein
VVIPGLIGVVAVLTERTADGVVLARSLGATLSREVNGG